MNIFYLAPNIDIPTHWLNILPVLPEPLPKPKNLDDGIDRVGIMNSIRLNALIDQDNSTEHLIPIPSQVRDKYINIGRTTPLYRARQLEIYLDTPAKIYFKREDLLPTSSFKLNSAIAQAYYAKLEGAQGLVTETGAGQWGLAVAYACQLFGLKAKVFWVKSSMEHKPQRATLAKLYQADVHPSPSMLTKPGRELLAKAPDCPGSIGTGISDAVSFASHNSEYKYVSGSNLPHVLLHQTIIGLETQKQLEALNIEPDIFVACVGGGSNLGGFMLPFINTHLTSKKKYQFLAAESLAAPRLTQGNYQYDHSDPAGLTPLNLSYSLGSDYMPPVSHSGGLRQHNGSSLISLLYKHNILQAQAYGQEEVFAAGKLLANTERILVAPETCHAIKQTIDVALNCKIAGQSKTIITCLSGNGLLDLSSYETVLANQL